MTAFLARGETPTKRRSRGFEAVASSPDGHYLYPAVEGRLADDANPFRRYIHEFDTRKNPYTGRSWQYRADGEDYRIADMQSLDANRAILIEREDDEGPAATLKRIYLIDRRHLDSDGFLVKTEVADLPNLRDPALIGSHDPTGGYGLGNPLQVPPAVRGGTAPPAGKPDRHRAGQQLPGQHRSRPRQDGRHRDDHYRLPQVRRQDRAPLARGQDDRPPPRRWVRSGGGGRRWRLRRRWSWPSSGRRRTSATIRSDS
ncbi:esterase-like activity of phytase family protein [Sphaerisporangium sp. NPDC049002]|uniref:esterase-like activity of phytase family protein n=1 Tax=Sphaerisporangium sp. NPDC049002 TaxID=3155392 RepID=UPI0033E4AD89